MAIRSATVIHLIYCVLSAALFSGCGGRNPATTGSTDVSGCVRIGISAPPRTLDPRLSTDVSSARIQQLVFNSLVRKNQSSEIVPDLAESWEIQDRRTYRFILRNNVRFHDGSMLTTRDVKATFDAILSDTLASPRKAAYEILESITIIDDRIIEFRTKEPFAPFLINMVLGILPASQASSLDPAQMIEPIGTGPFRFERQFGNERVVLTAFPDHFNGRPSLDRVEFRVIPDDGIRVMELEKGTIDFIQNDVPPDSIPRLRQHPNLKVMTAPGTSYYYVGFNFRLTDHPIADPAVRRALAMALNRDEIIEHVLGGLAEKAVGVLSEGHWAFNPDIPQMPFNRDKARQLLDQAGYPEIDGKRFELVFKVSQNKHSILLAEIVQAQWGAIGVRVRLRSLEWGTFYDDIIKGNFSVYIMSWVGVTDPDIYHSIFHSGSIPPNGRNRGHYRNIELDRLLDLARGEMDQENRGALYRRIQDMIATDLPYISLWHSHNVAVMKKNLANFQFFPAGDLDSFSSVVWMNTGVKTIDGTQTGTQR